MGRIAVLFVLAGLAVGLWLGFNPSTHRELVRLWDNATVSQAHRRSTTVFSLRQLDASVARLFRSAPRTRETPRTEPSMSTAWNQFVALLQSFWHALERIWASLTAKVTKPSSQ